MYKSNSHAPSDFLRSSLASNVFRPRPEALVARPCSAQALFPDRKWLRHQLRSAARPILAVGPVVVDAHVRHLAFGYSARRDHTRTGSFHNDDRSLYSIFWPPTTPDQIEAFVKYVRFVVNHFRGRIQLYALWNEQDITYWNPIANPEEYGRLLKAFVPAVHETDRQAKVIYGGLADPSSDFARRSLDACKCAAGIDVFAYHTYPGYGQNLNPESMDYGAYGPDAPVKLRETVRHYPGIRKDIPFWDDEFNSIPSWAGSDESVQAKYVSRGRIRGSMHPSRLCHLTFRRCVANPSFPSSCMGFGPKPASRLWRIGWERTVCPATFSAHLR